jgi:hypothetical protein
MAKQMSKELFDVWVGEETDSRISKLPQIQALADEK